MATLPEARAAEERRLLEAFEVYDRAVDVVSVFEWLHTDPGVEVVPSTVQHFERYPVISAPDGKKARPDFAIAFREGAAIVGEIARFSLRPESVDGLCTQIGRYERPPIIVQYAREGGKYTFQRLPDGANGTVRDGARKKSVGQYLSVEGLGVPAAKFAHVKAARAFVNDQMDPLYLATHLWAKTLPTMLGRPTGDPFTVNEAELADNLRAQYGHGKGKEVRYALTLLDRAGLAAEGDTRGEWKIAWRQPHLTRGRDLHQTIAARAAGTSKGARAIPTRRKPEPPAEQLALDL